MSGRANGSLLIDRPIVIVGCNRSGSTLLYRNLSEHPATWSLYIESQEVFYQHFPICPVDGDGIESEPTRQVRQAIIRTFYERAHNKEFLRDRAALGWISPKAIQRPLNRLYKRAPLRLVEKTPANSLRIPFLVQLFPDARFVFLVRRAEDVVSSLMEGWKTWSGTPAGQAWTFGRWHYLVPPQWQDWKERSLPEICAFQWVESNRTALADLERLRPGRYLLIRHEDAVAQPRQVYGKILEFCDLPHSRHMDRLVDKQERRLFTTRGSAPRRGKWHDLHGAEIETIWPMVRDLMEELYPGRSHPEKALGNGGSAVARPASPATRMSATPSWP